MAIKTHIRELRKSLNLSQVGLSLVLGTTQQTISRMEKSGDIPTDLLVRMSGFFDATTDYILGISEYKRDLGGQLRIRYSPRRINFSALVSSAFSVFTAAFSITSLILKSSIFQSKRKKRRMKQLHSIRLNAV